MEDACTDDRSVRLKPRGRAISDLVQEEPLARLGFPLNDLLRRAKCDSRRLERLLRLPLRHPDQTTFVIGEIGRFDRDAAGRVEKERRHATHSVGERVRSPWLGPAEAICSRMYASFALRASLALS